MVDGRTYRIHTKNSSQALRIQGREIGALVPRPYDITMKITLSKAEIKSSQAKSIFYAKA
jgi:hypothetical protein